MHQYNSTFSGVANYFVLFGLVVLMISCSSSGVQEVKVLDLENPIPVEKEAAIHPDTSLFQLNVKEWNEAPVEKRLSNCAAMVSISVDTFALRTNKDLNKLAEELFTCLDELTYGMPTMNDNAILNVSARCLYAMGYREASDTLSVK